MSTSITWFGLPSHARFKVPQVIQFLIVGCWALALGVGITTSAISDENYHHNFSLNISGPSVWSRLRANTLVSLGAYEQNPHSYRGNMLASWAHHPLFGPVTTLSNTQGQGPMSLSKCSLLMPNAFAQNSELRPNIIPHAAPTTLPTSAHFLLIDQPSTIMHASGFWVPKVCAYISWWWASNKCWTADTVINGDDYIAWNCGQFKQWVWRGTLSFQLLRCQVCCNQRPCYLFCGDIHFETSLPNPQPSVCKDGQHSFIILHRKIHLYYHVTQYKCNKLQVVA